jgi:hypothetical protein
VFDLPGTPPPAQGGPKTALQSSLTTAVVGQAETLTATVTSQEGVPTGTVTFKDGNTVLGTAGVNANGQAHLTGFFTGKGTFTLKAVYNGDALFAASSSQSLIEQVN